jgi:glycosyltransferase involved in cell wall biosynthesis
MAKLLISILKKEKNDKAVLFSISDELPDIIPAVIVKICFPRIKWIGSDFLFMPNPFKGYDYNFEEIIRFPDKKVLFAWFVEKIVDFLMTKYADLIFVTNELDKKRFVRLGFKNERIKATYGGINFKEVKVPKQKKIFDGIFVGRIHPQKGILHLIRIWKEVCKQKPNAKLAIIGNGLREHELRMKLEIKRLNLEKNIKLLGFVEGKQKYKILKASKVFLHTPVYDNCGMTAAEAMAAGLPVVRFNLPALDYPYPKGTVKIKLKDYQGFANAIIKLIDDKEFREKIVKEGREIIKYWDWNLKAKDFMTFIRKQLSW